MVRSVGLAYSEDSSASAMFSLPAWPAVRQLLLMFILTVYKSCRKIAKGCL